MRRMLDMVCMLQSRQLVPVPHLYRHRATEQAMSRESQGECGVVEAWLQTSITGLHALVGRIQVRTAASIFSGRLAPGHYHRWFSRTWKILVAAALRAAAV